MPVTVEDEPSRQIYQVVSGKCRIEKKGAQNVLGYIGPDDGVFGQIVLKYLFIELFLKEEAVRRRPFFAPWRREAPFFAPFEISENSLFLPPYISDSCRFFIRLCILYFVYQK